MSLLAAGKGDKAYTNFSTFNVEDDQVDLHYHFKGNTSRKGIRTEYVDFVGLDLEWETMRRFVTTRWLCLEKCCEKELRQYEAFKSMFESRTGGSSKQDRGNGYEKGLNSLGFSDLKWLCRSNVRSPSIILQCGVTIIHAF